MDDQATASREGSTPVRREPRMPLRDSDLRQAAFEDQLRPGDPSWSLLRELQERRDRANALGNGGR